MTEIERKVYKALTRDDEWANFDTTSLRSTLFGDNEWSNVNESEWINSKRNEWEDMGS